NGKTTLQLGSKDYEVELDTSLDSSFIEVVAFTTEVFQKEHRKRNCMRKRVKGPNHVKSAETITIYPWTARNIPVTFDVRPFASCLFTPAPPIKRLKDLTIIES